MITQLPEYKYLGMMASSKHLDGITGLVTGLDFRIASAPMVNVQPLPISNDKNQQNCWVVDIHMCDFTTPVKYVPPAEIEPFDVWLGDKVKDKVTGFEGIITILTISINGCAEIIVVGKDKDNNGKPPNSGLLNVKRFELIEQGAVTIDGMVSPTEERPTPHGAAFNSVHEQGV